MTPLATPSSSPLRADGYVAEAARAVLDHVLASGLPRVVAVTDPANSASQAVCERIGMRREAELRESHLQLGEWR